MAFQAGAIEATLELDRSPFQAGMKLAQAQAKRFAGQRYTATLDVDTREMQRSLRDVQAALRGLRGGRSAAAVGVDDRQARDALAGVRAGLAAVQKTRARPEIDTRSIVKAEGRVRLLLDGLVAFGPAAVPALSAATGAVVALGGAMGAAGAAATAFGVAAVGAYRDVFEAVSEVGKAQEQLERATTGSQVNAALDAQAAALGRLTAEQRTAAESVLTLRQEFRGFGDDIQPHLFVALDDAVEGARATLAGFRPLLPEIAAVAQDAAQDFRDFTSSADMADVVAFIRSQGVPALRTFVEAGRDGAVAVGNLLEAFSPLNADVLPAIRQAASDFRAWTANLQGSPEFEEFLAYVRDVGPHVWETIETIGAAAVDLFRAIAPLGGPSLMIIQALAEAVSLLTEHAPGLLQLAIAWRAGSAALTLLNRAAETTTPLVDRMRDALSQTTSVVAGTQTRIGAFASFLGGPWGIALAGGALALGVLATKNAEAEQRIDALTQAMLANNGTLDENTRASMVNRLANEGILQAAQKLKISLTDVTDASLGNRDAMERVDFAMRAARGSAERLDERFGGGIEAQKTYSHYAHTVRSALDGTNTELAEARERYRLAAEAQGLSVGPTDALTGALHRQAGAAREVQTEIIGTMDAHLQARRAELGSQQTSLSYKQAVEAQTRAQKELTAARKNYKADSVQVRGAELALAQTQLSTKQAMTQVIAEGHKRIEQLKLSHPTNLAFKNALERERDALLAVKDKSGEAKLAIQDYDTAISQVDKEMKTDVSVTATGKITINGKEFDTELVTPGVGARAPTARGQSGREAAGGPIVGPGTGTSDSIPAYLSNGEHVLTAAEVRAAGGHGAIYAMRASLLGRKDLPGEGKRFAAGGPAILPPFGIGMRDAILRSAEASRKALVEVFASTLKKAWTAAQAAAGGGGGPVAGGSVAAALEWARTQDGKPYQWGGGGNPSFDCSGFIAAIQRVMQGQQPGRLYTTMSFRGGSAPAGWEQGLTAPFMCGVYNGPSASNSHMAGTLNGVAVESSGSNGVQVGPPARGHSHSMFTHQYGFRPSLGDTEAGMARGGAVVGRGPSTGDTVPAWLSVGEHVWTAKEVRRAGGQNVMYALRKAFGARTRGEGMFYARGGRVRRPASEIGGGGGGGSESGTSDTEDVGAELTSPFEGFAEQLRGDAESIRSAIADAIEQIREGLTGKQAGSLVKVLQTAQTQLIAITGKIETAQENLSRVQQMRESATTGARELATVSGIGNAGSARDILALATQQRGQVTTFTRQLAALRRAGYARTIIEAAAGMGVEEGSEYARVLLSASAAQRRQLNAAEAAGLRAATGLGTAAFTAAGGAQYQAAVTSLTASLAKSAAALEKRLVPATLGLGQAGEELTEAAGALEGAAGSLTDAARKATGGTGTGTGGKKSKKSALKKRTYDDGGDLAPGATLAVNASGRTESTVTDAWRSRVEEALTRLLHRQGSVHVTQEFRYPVDPYAAASATVSKIVREVM